MTNKGTRTLDNIYNRTLDHKTGLDVGHTDILYNIHRYKILYKIIRLQMLYSFTLVFLTSLLRSA